MAKEKKKWDKFLLSLELDLSKEVENYRFENKFDNKQLAVRSLLRRGLDSYYAEEEKTDRQEKGK